MIIHINIGSNLGEREATLRRAIDFIISALPGTARISRPYESKAWGYHSENAFLNIGVSIELDTPQDAHDILLTLRAIERSIDSHPHRDDTGAYIDRNIDIDLIAVDGIVTDTTELTLPHPRMHLREFVLVPMTETAPDWLHPILHLTPRQLIDRLRCDDYSGR